MLEVTTLVKSAELSLNLVTMWKTFLAVRIASNSLAVSSAQLDEVDGLSGSLEVSIDVKSSYEAVPYRCRLDNGEVSRARLMDELAVRRCLKAHDELDDAMMSGEVSSSAHLY